MIWSSYEERGGTCEGQTMAMEDVNGRWEDPRRDGSTYYGSRRQAEQLGSWNGGLHGRNPSKTTTHIRRQDNKVVEHHYR